MRISLTTLAAILYATSVGAQPPIERPERILEVVRAFAVAQGSLLADDVDAEVGPVDARLRLRACDHEPEAFAPPRTPMQGRTAVGVRCRAPKAWTIYVPARIRQWREVVVADRQLQRGERLTAGDVRLVRHDTSSLTGKYLADVDAVVGKVVTRRVAAGKPLTAVTVAAPKVVKRGEIVTMTAGSGGLQVRVRGKALADGAVGDRITVENVNTRRRAEGVIIAPGRVRVR